MRKLRLVQLPVPPPAALAATGNVPLAAGSLGVSARVHGLARRLEVEVVAPAVTDSLGDTRLADLLARDEPDYLGLSLYLWNVERSLHLAREVKRRSPRTRVLIGGPEVSADNPFVLHQRGYDVAVSGEAEETFAGLMNQLLDDRDPAGLPGVSVRRPLGMSPFGPTPQAQFALDTYPSPYLEGMVPVEPRRSTYLETVRGCRSHCTFCFYPRSSGVLRVLDVPQSAALVGKLRELGARQVSFLDPTFNHRPGFEELVAAIEQVNPDRSVSFFAEVRAEGLTKAHCEALARAGFTKLEIGLQSVNRGTLKKVRRGGSPEKVALAARMLHDAGIELLVDLIVGLPGDTTEDVARGVEFLLENELGDEAQVFPLSLLPGTAMRAEAAADQTLFDPAPPYRVRQTSLMSGAQIAQALFSAEERLGRRVDEVPRPHLVSLLGAPDPADALWLDLDGPSALALQRAALPGAQHVALWLSGEDLFGRRDLILRALDARLAVDPFATLDVVLLPRGPIPLDLLELVRARLSAATPSYLSRALAVRGEDAQRRLCVVLPLGLSFEEDLVAALRELAPVFREQSYRQALRDAAELGSSLPGARVLDDALEPTELRELARLADTEAVVFASRALELAWQRGVLGLGDA